MMELGSGIALAGLCVSGGAVAITAIRTFGSHPPPELVEGKNGKDGVNGRNGLDAAFPCREHSGIVACMESIKSTGERHEEWLKEISADMKQLLRK